MTEVDGGIDLHQGDEVEFVVVKNQRNGKYSACNVRRIRSVYPTLNLFVSYLIFLFAK